MRMLSAALLLWLGCGLAGCERGDAPAAGVLRVQRVDPNGARVDPPWWCQEDTVLAVSAERVAGETATPVEALAWQLPAGDAVTMFGDDPLALHVAQPGTYTLTAYCGEQSCAVHVEATPREPVLAVHDLELMYIERVAPSVGDDGRPVRGDEVVWRAHVANWGPRRLPVVCEWRLDGAIVKEDEQRVPATGNDAVGTTFELRLPWDDTRHVVGAHVKSKLPVGERIFKNDQLTVLTDALPLALEVERSVWDWHRRHQHRLPLRDGNSFATWAQRHVRALNDALATAGGPTGPRLRLDTLRVLPDGALRARPERQHDSPAALQWTFPTGPVLDTAYWSVDDAQRAILANAEAGPAMFLDRDLLIRWYRAIPALRNAPNPFPPADDAPGRPDVR